MAGPIECKGLATTSEPSAWPISDTLSPSPVDGPVAIVDKLAMEENLRRLVLQSRKSKGKIPMPKPANRKDAIKSEDLAALEPALPLIVDPAPLAPLIIHPLTLSTNISNEVSPNTTATAKHASLDDLTVSFINDAIQTVEVPPLLQKASPSAMKILAAKQKRLERHINESKMLMAKLNVVSTKAEKENILSILRERTRFVCL
jgi:hypothetical protein